MRVQRVADGAAAGARLAMSCGKYNNGTVAPAPAEVAVASRRMRKFVVATVLMLWGAATMNLPPWSRQVEASERVPGEMRALRVQEPSDSEVEALLSAVFRVHARALDDARTNDTLGQIREGTGILIDDRRHVLTIGYLVIEPDSIELTSADGKTVPARLVAYDAASGFGLLEAMAPLPNAKPIEFGGSAALALREPVMVVPYGGRGAATIAYVVSMRPFAGSWEYMLDSAIYTAPPNLAWAGSALVNREGHLVGIGSLLVRDSVEPGTPFPGNLFVPTDLLKPILADLIAKGRAGPPRPWMGLGTEEVHGHLVITRVAPEGPAERAGLREGDIVTGVGGEAVRTHAEFYRKVWKLGTAGVEVPLRVLQGTDVREIRLKSIDRAQYFRQKPGL